MVTRWYAALTLLLFSSTTLSAVLNPVEWNSLTKKRYVRYTAASSLQEGLAILNLRGAEEENEGFKQLSVTQSIRDKLPNKRYVVVQMREGKDPSKHLYHTFLIDRREETKKKNVFIKVPPKILKSLSLKPRTKRFRFRKKLVNNVTKDDIKKTGVTKPSARKVVAVEKYTPSTTEIVDLKIHNPKIMNAAREIRYTVATSLENGETTLKTMSFMPVESGATHVGAIPADAPYVVVQVNDLRKTPRRYTFIITRGEEKTRGKKDSNERVIIKMTSLPGKTIELKPRTTKFGKKLKDNVTSEDIEKAKSVKL